MSTPIFFKVKEFLDSNKIDYRHTTHAPVGRTSESAAQVRGTSVENALKAIILKINDEKFENSPDKFFQVSIPGLQRIDTKKLKNYFNVKNISLASPDEVLEKTGCVVGSVPPFGNLFNMKIYCDNSIFDVDEILFSAGSHTDTIFMKPESYVEIVNPVIIDLKKDTV